MMNYALFARCSARPGICRYWNRWFDSGCRRGVDADGRGVGRVRFPVQAIKTKLRSTRLVVGDVCLNLDNVASQSNPQPQSSPNQP